MLDDNIESINHDMKVLVGDAQALFHAAAALSGEKAEEVRGQGMRLLDAVVSGARRTQDNAVAATKTLAKSTDSYVGENPWSVVAAATAIGLLAGLLLARR